MRYSKFTSIILGSLLLTACATTSQPSLMAGSPGMGNAVKANMEAQKVAPTAEQKANTYIPANRARQSLARKAYEDGEVKEPVPLGVQGSE